MARNITVSQDTKDFIKALGLDPGLTRRVIIDIDQDSAVIVYTEQYIDASRFELMVDAVAGLSLNVVRIEDVKAIS